MSVPALPAMTRDEFTYVRQLLLERAGIQLEAGKEYLAQARLSELAVRRGFRSITALLDRVQIEGEGGRLERQLVEAMTITETSFFRDLHPFEALRTTLLPELIASRAGERTLRVWSAAAASGQEPYSLALLLREHFPQLRDWAVSLVASDISEAMLARARAGVYSQLEINRGLPARLLVRYFRKYENEWHLDAAVRRMVEFRRINLTGPWPPLLPADLVLLRNVLIYFDVPTKRTILERISRVMRPGGYLLLGGGETTLNLVDHFTPTTIGRAIAYRLSPRGMP